MASFRNPSRNTLRPPRLRPNHRHPRRGNVIDPATGKSRSRTKSSSSKTKKSPTSAPTSQSPPAPKSSTSSNEWLMPGVDGRAYPHHRISRPQSRCSARRKTISWIAKVLRVLYGLKIATNNYSTLVSPTTVRDVGNEADYASVDLRNAINKGWFTGPNDSHLRENHMLLSAARDHHLPPEVGPRQRYEYIDADGPEEIRKAVRENIFYGIA